MLAYLLKLEEFQIEVKEDKVYAGYSGEELLCLSPFVIGQDEVPCILHQSKRNQNREYINYFYGEYTIPDLL